MAPKFGTSGLRGLVVEMTPDLVSDYIRAFVTACDLPHGLFVGRDLRPSSPDIAETVIAAARDMGLDVTDCGALPTPALALAAHRAGAGAVMVTGSHIPADRNGLKFYTPTGEITKEDEARIGASLGQSPKGLAGNLVSGADAVDAYVRRYVDAFGDTRPLTGRRIGVYSHSTVGRDVLGKILSELGAGIIEFARSDIFIPVDTEAVDADTVAQIRNWVAEASLDALVSCDGDADRPLLADEAGHIVAGDILGQITARFLRAETVVTPVSSNSGVMQVGFNKVIRTKIGSPYVIAGMAQTTGRVVGYEANGGFLLGFSAQMPGGDIDALPTRDAVLPLIAVLVEAFDTGKCGKVSLRVAQEPPVVTLADRLQHIPQENARAFLDGLQSVDRRQAFLAQLGAAEEHDLDETDGLRMLLRDGSVIHFRPSGNAPEFRIYVEAESDQTARDLLQRGLRILQEELATK